MTRPGSGYCGEDEQEGGEGAEEAVGPHVEATLLTKRSSDDSNFLGWLCYWDRGGQFVDAAEGEADSSRYSDWTMSAGNDSEVMIL